MHRLSISAHRDSFVLKGGLLVTLWIGDGHRVTRDADFLGFGAASEERLISMFAEVMSKQVDDGLVYDIDSLTARAIREEQQYGGIRIRTAAYLGKTRIPIVVDVGFEDATIAPNFKIEYPTLLDMPPVSFGAYPPASVVAEKFHAIVTLGLVPTTVPAGLSNQFFADPQKTRQWSTYAASISLEGVSLEKLIDLAWTRLAPACERAQRRFGNA